MCVCRYIISASWDKTVRVWDVANGTCVKELNGHTDEVSSVCVLPDNRYIEWLN